MESVIVECGLSSLLAQKMGDFTLENERELLDPEIEF